MAIRALAGKHVFFINNANRETANPPVQIPDLTPTSQMSSCIWGKALSQDPAILFQYYGTTGGHVSIGHSGGYWFVSSRNDAGVLYPYVPIAPVVLDRWCLFGLQKIGNTYTFNFQMEADPPDTMFLVGFLNPPTILEREINSPFSYIAVFAEQNLVINNFKIWDVALPENIISSAANRWDQLSGPGVGNPPIWSSTLRTPGDISSITNPYTNPNWEHGHAYSGPIDESNLKMEADPAYMAINSFCPTWVYPLGTPRQLTTVSVNPGTTPLIPTIYKSTKFWEFQDKGSVPTNTPFLSVKFYAIPYSSGTGVAQTDSWGLYKDDNGVEHQDTSGPNFRFEVNTGVDIPGGVTSATMYAWKYGAQFTYPGQSPTVPTATANVSNLLLYVVYKGQPSGIPQLPAQDLAGLFVINKGGPSLDRYNRGVELKIPDPVIRTAYIGE